MLQWMQAYRRHPVKQAWVHNCLPQQMKLVSASDGKCHCELRVQPNMLNVSGKLHGGVTASLVDAVSTYALTTTGQGRPGSSIDLSVSYLRPVNEGEDISISAQTLRCGKKVAVCTVEVTSKSLGQLLAHGKHTKYMGEAAAQESSMLDHKRVES